MKNKRGVAVVTGAADGIGAATARGLAPTNEVVVINYRTRRPEAESVADDIRSRGGRAVTMSADVADPCGAHDLFTFVDELGVPLRLLVNNAGATGGFSTVDALDIGQLDSAYRNCLRSTVLCTAEAVRRMVGAVGGGSIINISSTAARTTGAGEWVHYAAVKAAVNTWTRGAALELASRDIRVNAVAPGLIESPLHARNGDPGRPDRLRASIPAARIGQAEEVAAAVAFLASPSASYITGHVLEVSGGR
jgi:NAD(P)-dependent dehydrogenase (short-subunit alcohol dehydrogenase family)